MEDQRSGGSTVIMAEYQRILLSRLRFVGDIVLTTPVIRSVRAACPEARIAYLGDCHAVSLLQGNPHLNEIIPYDFSRPAALEQARVAWLLRRRGFDLAIDMFNNPRSALLTYATGARVRVGLERRGRGMLYTLRVRDDGRPKTPVEFHGQFLLAAGISPSAAATELFLAPDERASIQALLPEGTAPLIGIHPGATWPAKRWPAERFADLADRLAGSGYRVVITAGPGESDVIRRLLNASGSAPHVLPLVPLRALAAAISRCSVFVSNDAGPMHIAAALGVPTVGIFGPGEENIWFPYDPALGHTALRRDVPCHPCHLDFCPRPGDGYMECMKLLCVDEVEAAVERGLLF
jgi:lipopolysaccharide heptosyltransferase II